MRRPTLRLVVNNPGLPKRHALVLTRGVAQLKATFAVNVGKVAVAVKRIVAILLLLVTLPFKLLRRFGSFCVSVGLFLFESIVNLFIGLFGFSLLFCLGYGVVYTMLIKPWLM